MLQYLILLLFLFLESISSENVCYKESSCSQSTNLRYMFYDVNPPEGFNLRRDVYMRFAVLAHKLQKSTNPNLNKFRLVLPPWSHMVHWTYSDTPEHIPWGYYFDLKSLKMFAPVVEMYEFFNNLSNKYSKVVLDEVYTLQHFEDMFESGNFEDRMKIDKCLKNYQHHFLFYSNITAKSFKCLSYHGPATKLTELLLNTTANKIFLEHAEVALHDTYGDKVYWRARRSMRFSKDLREIANKFRKTYLNSSDEQDKTVLPENWTEEKDSREAIGGPYLAVHLRRRDFIRNRPNEAPPIEDLARQVVAKLRDLKLSTVFVATDGNSEEYETLLNHLGNYKVFRFKPTLDFKAKYKDGGVAIVDQIICSHAIYFIGTHESTFSFRIQEEREILGFDSQTTFNVFCKQGKQCQEPNVWKIQK